MSILFGVQSWNVCMWVSGESETGRIGPLDLGTLKTLKDRGENCGPRTPP